MFAFYYIVTMLLTRDLCDSDDFIKEHSNCFFFKEV